MPPIQTRARNNLTPRPGLKCARRGGCSSTHLQALELSPHMRDPIPHFFIQQAIPGLVFTLVIKPPEPFCS